MPYHRDDRPVPPSSALVRNGRPDTLGLQRKAFINAHRNDYTGRTKLLQGSVKGLVKDDESNLLILYLREPGPLY